MNRRMIRSLTPDRLRTVTVLAAMALFVATVYGVVRAASAAAGRADPGLGVWLAVTAVVAALAPDARRRAERYADRVAYGPDGDPHAVMTRFVQRISDTLAVDEVLPDLARTASRVTHSPGTEVRLWLADGAEWRQTWPPDRADVQAQYRLELQCGTDPVGQLAVEVTEDHLSPADRELLDRLAGPAGLALANVRLTYELRDRLRQATDLTEQLRRSRERLIWARDAQRRRFAAEIHERVDPHLAAVLEALERLPDSGRSPSAGLEQARTRVLAALEALRELATGLYPPALADGGLIDALEHHIDAAAAPVTLDHTIEETSFAPSLRTAAYFCVVGLVDDLAHHGPVGVRLHQDGARMRLEVRAPGRPTADTEQIIRDRVEAFGGVLDVGGSAPRTVVSAVLPLRAPAELPIPVGAGPRR